MRAGRERETLLCSSPLQTRPIASTRGSFLGKERREGARALWGSREADFCRSRDFPQGSTPAVKQSPARLSLAPPGGWGQIWEGRSEKIRGLRWTAWSEKQIEALIPHFPWCSAIPWTAQGLGMQTPSPQTCPHHPKRVPIIPSVPPLP